MKLCSHFSANVVEVVVPRGYVPMQVPVYRCSLADKMVTRLRPIPGGLWLADKIEAQPLEDHARLICGPDLNAISATTCVPDRCHRRCRAAFNPVLTDLGLSGELIDD